MSSNQADGGLSQALHGVQLDPAPVGTRGTAAGHFDAGAAARWPISGRKAIDDFFDWVEQLACGIDLFDQRNYQLPNGLLAPSVARRSA